MCGAGTWSVEPPVLGRRLAGPDRIGLATAILNVTVPPGSIATRAGLPLVGGGAVDLLAALGLAEGAFEEARNYVRDRTVFGKAIGDFQGVRWKLAEMYREIETARSILYRACITANPFPDPFMAAVAKISCNEMSNRVTSEAIQLHGGFGFTDEFAVSRLYRGARYGTLGGGTSETLRDLIGKRIMDAGETGAELLAYDMMNGA